LKVRASTVVIICIIILIMLAFTVLLMTLKDDFDNLKFIQLKQQEEHQRTNQFLLSTIDWSTKRQKLILFLRDLILEERSKTKKIPPIAISEAYLIAETNVLESEKYSCFDPILFTAMQRRESMFDKKAISPEGALGINQLMPSTGRLLCASFGQEYSDSILFDIKISTKFAAKLFDVLYATHHKTDLVLADYNGGPFVAAYYKSKSGSLPQETADYVPCVMKTYELYNAKFALYKVDSTLLEFDKSAKSEIESTLKMNMIKKIKRR